MDDLDKYRTAEEQAKAEMLQRAIEHPNGGSFDAGYYATRSGHPVEEVAYAMSVHSAQGQKNEVISLIIGLVLFAIIGIPCLLIFVF